MVTVRARAVVVYESMFGDTADVARAVARGLEGAGIEVSCVDVGRVEPGGPFEADLLVVGAPTHALSLSERATREEAVRRGALPDRAGPGVREWLAAASPGPAGPVVATFDTRLGVLRHVSVAAAVAAARMARERGFRVVDEPAGFLVDGVRGPVSPGELARAEAWGASLATVLAGAR